MTVLIEALGVVLRADALVAKFPGGMEAFAASVPPRTLCGDGELVRISFMVARGLQEFVERLESSGFVHLRDGKAIEIVVVDETRGMLSACDWAEFARVPWICAPLGPVAICKRPGSRLEPIVTPEGWDYMQSPSSLPDLAIG